MIGAVCGFAAGLLLDSALLQTLGVSSLVLLGAGYLAGRYREGAEISNSLIPPLLAGALTTAAAAGFAAIQLMLGVRHAGQPPGPAGDLRPGPAGGAADDPDLSADPLGPAPGDRRRLRRARRRRSPITRGASRRGPGARAPRQARGGGLADVRRARATPDAGAVRAARGDPQRPRAGDVLDHLLPPLVPAGAVGRQVPEAGREQPGPRDHRAGAARRDPRSQRPRPGRQPHRAGAPAPADRAAALAPQAPAGVRAARPGDRHVARRDPQAAPPADQGAAGEPGDPEARRRLRPRLLPAREPGPVPRGERAAASTSATTRTAAWRRRSSATCARSPRSSSRRPATRASCPATRSASRGSRTPTTTSCGASTA